MQGESARRAITGAEFFNRYPSLHSFLLTQLQAATRQLEQWATVVHPSLTPVLALLSRLRYPSSKICFLLFLLSSHSCGSQYCGSHSYVLCTAILAHSVSNLSDEPLTFVLKLLVRWRRCGVMSLTPCTSSEHTINPPSSWLFETCLLSMQQCIMASHMAIRCPTCNVLIHC